MGSRFWNSISVYFFTIQESVGSAFLKMMRRWCAPSWTRMRTAHLTRDSRQQEALVSPHIQFDLLTNARDSLRQAVNLLAWKDIRSDQARLKHAITNAAHSIELLLKE